jgi:hypothetical protein
VSDALKGPFVVTSRAHSGSRVLAEALVRNKVWMGELTASFDARGFGNDSEVVRKLMRHGSRYHRKDESVREHAREMARGVVRHARESMPADGDYLAFGWKQPRTNFYVEVLMDAVPEAKVLHLIRDGRDCMLSRIRSATKIYKPGGRLLIYGNRRYPVADTSAEYIKEHRNELEMHLWVTSVRMGMKGRKYPERYLEVFYEDLCREPIPTLEKVFAFLGMPFLDETREWAAANIRQSRIGKWVGREEELKEAIAIGEPLLRELGYLDAPAHEPSPVAQ